MSSLGGAGGKICGKKSSVRRLCRVQCNFHVCDFFFSLSLSLSPLPLSSFLPLLRCVLCWHLGVRGVASVHVDVCLHAMFSVWRGLLLRTQRRFPDSQTRQGSGGRGGRDDRQMQARKFFGYSGKTLRLGTPYKLPRGEVWQGRLAWQLPR